MVFAGGQCFLFLLELRQIELGPVGLVAEVKSELRETFLPGVHQQRLFFRRGGQQQITLMARSIQVTLALVIARFTFFFELPALMQVVPVDLLIPFAYGLPHKPFITQILPHGLSLPRVPKGDQVWQHSEACQQRVDADGNWLRQTDGKIQDKAIEREVEAMQNTESFQSHTRTVDDHSTESVGGIKKIEALGALKLLSGGSASLAAVDDLHQATGRDLNLVVGQKHNATVGGDMEERIQGLRKSAAAVSQRMTAPKTWLGSEGVNVLQVLCDLLDLVQQMNTQLAAHTHGPTPVPGNAAAFSGYASDALSFSTALEPITL